MKQRRRISLSAVPHILVLLALLVGPEVLAAQQEYTPSYQFPEGKETLLVLIVSSGCQACQDPAVKNTIATMLKTEAERAAEKKQHFAAIGVSLDWSPREGFEFLESLGDFDELAVGRNWLNTAVHRYIWHDIPGPPSVPQVVLLEREVGQSAAGITISNERLLRRYIGLQELQRWNLSADQP